MIVLDLAQIECRMLNVLAGEWDVVEAFRTGRDIYSEGASRFYGRTITKNDPLERHLGKTTELGCGFGMGATKLRVTLRRGALGGPPIDLDERQADSAIQAYRRSHPNVVAYWGTAGRMISRLAGGDPCDWGPMRVDGGRIYLPNGAWLNYRTLEYDRDWEAWKIQSRQGWVKLYGGKLVENVVQALARVVLSQAMLRIAEFGYTIATCTHDEVVIVLPKGEWARDSQVHFNMCKELMEQAPAWLPELPVKAEGGISERYEK